MLYQAQTVLEIAASTDLETTISLVCFSKYTTLEMTFEIPTTMLAWRKHKGDDKPVWEEVSVPKPSKSQILVRLLASGGDLIKISYIVGLCSPSVTVCRSDISLLRYDNQPSWFQDRYTLVSLVLTPDCHLMAGINQCLRATKDADVSCNLVQVSKLGLCKLWVANCNSRTDLFLDSVKTGRHCCVACCSWLQR